MDFKCRGSTKYFALMLYCLFSAELDERRCGGNVNSIYCGWVYYEGWLLLGCPVFQPFLFNWSNFNLPFYCLKVDFHCRVILYVRTHVNFTRVNEIDTVYGSWRVNVKIEPRSTFTFTRGLSYMISFSFTRVNFTCVSTEKKKRQWKATLNSILSARLLSSFGITITMF